MEKISVIIPVYKVEKFLPDCVDSVLSQTYTNLEVILVDDGSPDRCGAICDEYAEKDSRVKVIHKENGGQGSARNRGLDAATGDYIAFVDSDDWIDPDMYEVLLKLLLEHDADIAEASYRFYRPWKTENKTLECPNTQKVFVWEAEEILERFYFGPDLFSDVAVMVWNKLYKASLLRDLRFREGFIYEDSEFMPRVLYACKKLVKYDRSVYTYNIHLSVGETSHSEKNYFKISSSVISSGLVAEFFADKGNEKLAQYTRRRYWNMLLEAYYNCWLLRKEPQCHDYGKELRKRVHQEKNAIRKSPDFEGKWQFTVFLVSSTLFCLMKKAFRGAKALKYRIRVMLTGRN